MISLPKVFLVTALISLNCNYILNASDSHLIYAVKETPQVKINGNELRVDGKKKDDLQNVMQLIEESNIGIPVQFINFRD